MWVKCSTREVKCNLCNENVRTLFFTLSGKNRLLYYHFGFLGVLVLFFLNECVTNRYPELTLGP